MARPTSHSEVGGSNLHASMKLAHTAQQLDLGKNRLQNCIYTLMHADTIHTLI